MSSDSAKVEIWTDVDGIRTADPRVVEKTSRIEEISYEEAAEMAYLGARVLHPLTIEPARRKNIPIKVLNSKNPDCEGSSVVKDDSISDGPKSIAFRDEIDYIVVSSERLDGVSAMLAVIFEIMNSCNVAVILVSATESKVSLTLESGQLGIEEAIRQISERYSVIRYRDKAQVSVVGKNVIMRKRLIDDMKDMAGNIYMVTEGAGLMNISFVIDKDKIAETVNGLHNKLF
jgi:aspartate kinase